MRLTITITKETTTKQEALTIYNFLKQAASPYPGMRVYAAVTENEPPYEVPEPEPPT